MKKLITLLILVVSVISHGQTKVGYYYDNNGNRYQRYFIGVRPARQDSVAPTYSTLKSPSQLTSVTKDPEKLAIEYGVKVYPNPTTDLIMVSIIKEDKKESKNADMSLIDNTGKVLDRKKYSGTEISFDLSKNPPGNYYLKIIFEDHSKLNYNVVKVN